MEKRKLEVLAPAGSFESLKAAVSAGADAVYMGGSKFGARAYAQNPEGEILLDAIDYAHLYGVKLYLTVNTLLKDQELEQELYEYLKPCYEHGLDAVLVQDLGVLCAIRKWFPSLPVHASTQMTICGPGSVGLLKEMGVERAVLSRELSLKEIADIHQKTGMELETFVHGALCYCYSGQCLFSSILGGRSGNRGRCAQPCRLAYQAVDAQKKALTGEQTLLSPKDICALDLIPQIAEAGVYSLKIEGRMKRPEYTAGVVRIYRKYVDQYLQNGAKGYQVAETDRKELLLLFNRDGFSRGYYEQHNGRNMMALENAKASDQEKRAYEALIEKLHAEYVETERKVPVRGQFRAVPEEPMQLTLSCRVDGQICQVEVTGEVPQQAQNRPMEEAQFLKQMKKLGGTPFTWEQLDLCLEGTLFVPVGALNNLRRTGLEALQKALVERYWREQPKAKEPEEAVSLKKAAPGTQKLHVSVETKEQLQAVLDFTEERTGQLHALYLEAETFEAELQELVPELQKKASETGNWKVYVLLPAVFRLHTKKRYEEKLQMWKSLPADGYVIRNPEEYVFLKDAGCEKEILLDHNVYTFNKRSRQEWTKRGVLWQTNPLELNARELKEISYEYSIQVVYGRYPMMVTAGCVHRTLNQCKKKPEQWFLRDRYRKEFPVKNYCLDCYNMIYNSQPLYLLDRKAEVETLGAGACRMMFTTEKGKETRELLERWITGTPWTGEFTRGHFKRGVE